MTAESPSNTIYISIDVEADGPIPGPYSMLQLGAAAFHPDHYVVGQSVEPQARGTFQQNLLPLEGAQQHPDTMAWWKRQDPKVWETVTSNPKPPFEVMTDFVQWTNDISAADNSRPVIVGYPVTYDFMFVYWYTVNFTGCPAPFGFQGIDIKTLAMARLGIDFRQTTKRRMPKRWFKGCPKHTHIAVEDAIGQGGLFMNMLLEERAF